MIAAREGAELTVAWGYRPWWVLVVVGWRAFGCVAALDRHSSFGCRHLCALLEPEIIVILRHPEEGEKVQGEPHE